MAFLNDEQKKMVAPFMAVIVLVLSLSVGYVCYTLTGGEPIPVLKVVVPILAGIAGFLIARNAMKNW